MNEQLKLFDDGHESKKDRLYDLLVSELTKDLDDTAAHLAATDIAQRLKDEKMYCECGGSCACER